VTQSDPARAGVMRQAGHKPGKTKAATEGERMKIDWDSDRRCFTAETTCCEKAGPLNAALAASAWCEPDFHVWTDAARTNATKYFGKQRKGVVSK